MSRTQVRRLASCSMWLVSAAAFAQSVVLDDFERADPAPWRYSGKGTLSIVSGHAPGSKGARVMRLETTAALRNDRIWWGEMRITPPSVSDWTRFHYVSAWVRASGGRRVHAISLYAANRGKRLESHHMVLPHNEWVRVSYPITHLVRDNITLFFFSHFGCGALPGEALDEVYEFDDVTLEPGPPAPMAGWAVTPGRAAFAHCGYQPAEPKRILFPPNTSGPAIVRRANGSEVRQVKLKADAFGNRVADITDLRESGTFTVEAGGTKTEPFPIGRDAWRAPAEAVIRFIYCMRCGCKVDDSRVGHGPCHLDNCRPMVSAKLDPKRWPLAKRHMELLGDWFDLTGGWHDAGIIDQYTGNTGLMAYALACLAETRPEVRTAALDEALWGARWCAKATLPTGDMVMSSPGQVRWTDNKPGTDDDRTANVAGCWPDHAMKALAGMAKTIQLMGQADPALREKLLAAVRRAVHHFHTVRFPGYTIMQFQFVSWGALAGVEAHAATGDAESLAFALACLKALVACQDEAEGFFYKSTSHRRPFRFVQGQGIGALALAVACTKLPKRPEAATWRAALERWCDGHAKPMTQFAGGYGIVALGLYNDDEDTAYNTKDG